jgi:hypothetical protein
VRVENQEPDVAGRLVPGHAQDGVGQNSAA